MKANPHPKRAQAKKAKAKDVALAAAPKDSGEGDSRTAQIIAGLPNHTNEQACCEGRRGFWVQTDCVLIEQDTPEAAIAEFRRKMASGGSIAVCHNFGTSGIRMIQQRTAADPKDGIALIAAERARQVSQEGWTPAIYRIAEKY